MYRSVSILSLERRGESFDRLFDLEFDVAGDLAFESELEAEDLPECYICAGVVVSLPRLCYGWSYLD